MDETEPLERKRALKRKLIEEIVRSLDTLTLNATDTKPSARYKNSLPNNAYFMNFRRYQSKQDLFWDEYKGRFNENLKAYIKFLSEKYPFL